MAAKLIKARVNHRQTLAHMITAPVQGPDGIFIALQEAINNSFDAQASEIKIRQGTFEGKPALIISDNGCGFNQKAIQSVMSYALSSKKRGDLKTVGVNGTGLKHFLGLSIEKAQITILSVNKEVNENLESCTKMQITFEYLVALAQKKTKAEDYVTNMPVPQDWEVDVNRKTGSTIIITGYDGRKMKTAGQMIEDLAEYLTPKALSFISIKNGDVWSKPNPVSFRGNQFTLSHKSEKLGDVHCDLWYGGNGDGPIVCGHINTIIPLMALWSKMGKEQKKKVSKIWKTVAGHIYIEKANYFRQHDGTFSDEFFQPKILGEFIQLLELVSEELEKLSDQAVNTKSEKEKAEFLNRVIEMARTISPINSLPTLGDSGNSLIPKVGDVSEDVYIVPRNLRLHPGVNEKITLQNLGRKKIDFSGSLWSTSDESLLTIENAKSGSASIKPLKTGKATISILGAFGTHTINIIIEAVSTEPFIKGPTSIKPNSVYQYTLEKYTQDVYWDIEGMNEFTKLIPDMDNPKRVSVKVEEHAPEKSFTLLVYSKNTKKVIAKREINVSVHGGKNKPPVIRIGKKDYMLEVGTYNVSVIAQIDSFTENGIPAVVLNPLHPRIRKVSAFKSSETILNAIACVAVMNQIEEGLLKTTEGVVIVEDFVTKIKEKIYPSLHNKIEE